MAITAFVREWHDDEGWGVLDSTETPGGCWAHRSNASVRGYATFTAGQEVRMEFEAAGQDGYAFRAFRFWPADQAPARTTDTPTPADQAPARNTDTPTPTDQATARNTETESAGQDPDRIRATPRPAGEPVPDRLAAET